jgi:hypothetical protein
MIKKKNHLQLIGKKQSFLIREIAGFYSRKPQFQMLTGQVFRLVPL